MLFDRVLGGLGAVVITGGAVLGWVGAPAQFDNDTDTSAVGDLPLLPIADTSSSLSEGADDDAGSGYAAGPAAATDSAAAEADAADAVPADTAEVRSDGWADLARHLAGTASGLQAPAAVPEAPVAEPAAAKPAVNPAPKAAPVKKAAKPAAKAATDPVAKPVTGVAAKSPTKVAVSAPAPAEIVRQTYSYGPYGDSNLMDVLTPRSAITSATKLPTIVLVHGGSWVHGTKASWPVGLPEEFVKAGYTVVAINYRLAGVAAWPAQRTDVVAAVNELKQNAERYNVDPDHIVLVGSSAGGHLVAAAGTWEGAPNLVRGFVSFSGPMDLYQVVSATGASQETLAGFVTKDLMRCAAATCADRYDDATPANHLDPDDVPSLLVASKDEWVSPQGARDFAAKARDLGVASDLLIVPGKAHAIGTWPASRTVVMSWIAGRMKD